jgi:zinc transport system permease protein
MLDLLYSILPFTNPLMNHALIAAVLSSMCFGIIGSFVVVKRITSAAGSIAHSSLSGIGVALFLKYNLSVVWFTPLIGAFFSALLSAIIIGLVSLFASEREDTIISAVWAIGMAVGMLFILFTQKYLDAMNYLFGEILLISASDLLFIVILDLIVISLCIIFYNKLLAVSFDQEFAKLRGVHSEIYFLLLLLMTALTIVLMVTIVGILLVIALLTLPAAIAGLFFKKLWQIMIASTLLCLVFTIGGLLISYVYDIYAGPVIILFAGGIYLAVLIFSSLRKKFKKYEQL